MGADTRKRRSLDPSWTKRSRSRNSVVVAAKTWVIIPAPKLARLTFAVRRHEIPPIRSSPAPRLHRNCPVPCGERETARGGLMNSTFRSPGRDESRPRYGEPFESADSEGANQEQNQTIVRCSISFP